MAEIDEGLAVLHFALKALDRTLQAESTSSIQFQQREKLFGIQEYLASIVGRVDEISCSTDDACGRRLPPLVVVKEGDAKNRKGTSESVEPQSPLTPRTPQTPGDRSKDNGVNPGHKRRGSVIEVFGSKMRRFSTVMASAMTRNITSKDILSTSDTDMAVIKTIVASCENLCEREVIEAARAFKALDTDNDGYLTVIELTKYFKEIGQDYSADTINKLIMSLGSWTFHFSRCFSHPFNLLPTPSQMTTVTALSSFLSSQRLSTCSSRHIATSAD
jgi:hypothetical protein